MGVAVFRRVGVIVGVGESVEVGIGVLVNVVVADGIEVSVGLGVTLGSGVTVGFTVLVGFAVSVLTIAITEKAVEVLVVGTMASAGEPIDLINESPTKTPARMSNIPPTPASG